MNRPSGDQKRKVAPSVSGSGCEARESSWRTQSRSLPEESVALKARRPPSGEIAKSPPKWVKFGVGIENRIARLSIGGLRKYAIAKGSAAISARTGIAVAAIQTSRSRFLPPPATGPPLLPWEPDQATHSNSRIGSRAVSHRSSGSFSRQVFPTRSSAGGVIG